MYKINMQHGGEFSLPCYMRITKFASICVAVMSSSDKQKVTRGHGNMLGNDAFTFLHLLLGISKIFLDLPDFILAPFTPSF